MKKLIIITIALLMLGCVKQTLIEPIVFTNKEGFKNGDVICLSDSIYGGFVIANACDNPVSIIGIVQSDSGIIVCKSFQGAVDRHIKIHNEKLKTK